MEDGDSPDRPNGSHSDDHGGNTRLDSLKKQLAVENKVKQGAENMLAMYTNLKSKDKSKLIAEAQQMLEDAKTKMEIIRMAILREQQAAAAAPLEEERTHPGSKKPNAAGIGLLPIELRVEEVRHHIDIETRVIDGARTLIKFLQKSGQKEKGLLEVRDMESWFMLMCSIW